MTFEYERYVALEAVMKSCHLCQKIRTEELLSNSMEKEDKSPVTIADFGTQAVISMDLLRAFPNDHVMAEENLASVKTDLRERIVQQVSAFSPELNDEQIFFAIDRCNYRGGSTERFWVLDPVDGTKGFLRGDQYAIALALIEDGSVVLGVLGCPNLPLELKNPERSKGCIFVATEDQGAKMRTIDDPFEKMISVSEITEPTKGSFCESFEPTSTSHSKAARIAKMLGIRTPPLRMDSQCKYGIVARGDASIYLRLPSKPGYEETIWDHTAGWLIVKEAGGEITDVNGRPLDFSTGRTLSKNRGLVATSGKFHTQVLSAVQRILDNE